MADDFIQLPADGAGKKLDSESLTIGANTVHRERLQLSGAVAAEVLAVKNTDPAGSAYGGVVRPIMVIAPARSSGSSAALAAGATVNIDSVAIVNAKTGKLVQVTVASTVAAKWVIQTRAGATIVTVDVLFTGGISGEQATAAWRSPDKAFVTLVGNGIDTTFRVAATNLDARNAADVYATFWWDEV